jgi:hypothetical protein
MKIKISKTFAACVLLTFTLTTGQVALAQSQHNEKPQPSAAEAGLLPRYFAGWQMKSQPAKSSNSATADAPNAKLLSELGFTDSETATYQRQGRNLVVSAFRFADTTGAHGAFSAYRDPQMTSAKFCDQGATNGNSILFSCTNVLIKAEYDKVTAMSASEARSLAEKIPRISGSAALAPNLPFYVPDEAQKDVQYAIGPAGLSHTPSPLSAEIIDFNKGAEVAVSKFPSLEGTATITLVKYPTFKLATERQKAFDAFARSRPKAGLEAPLDTFYTKRVGPIVAVITGEITENDAKNLAEKISYDAEITRNEPGYTQKDNVANLVLNVIYLALIIIAFTAVTGIAFGGVRILLRKWFPNKVIDRPEDVEFIRLDLKD